MKKKLFLVMALFIFTVLLQSGCSATGPQDKGSGKSEDNQADRQKAIMEEFNAGYGKEASPAGIIKFAEKNISLASREDASAIIARLEESQKAALPGLDKKISYNSSFQEKIGRVYSRDFSLSRIDSINDSDLKALLAEVRDGGYKIDTAEGMFFPMIDYGLYKKFSPYVTPDIKEYIEIMSVESDQPPARDAALVIGWDEVVRRAVSQESFINTHKDSSRLDSIKQLYNKYVDFSFYGTNNKPLFSYDTKKLAPGVKEAYAGAAGNSENSNFSRALKDYLAVIEKSGYKLTDEVDSYRKSAAAGLKL